MLTAVIMVAKKLNKAQAATIIEIETEGAFRGGSKAISR